MVGPVHPPFRADPQFSLRIGKDRVDGQSSEFCGPHPVIPNAAQAFRRADPNGPVPIFTKCGDIVSEKTILCCEIAWSAQI